MNGPSAKTPNDLEKLFVARANAGDVEGLLALYQQDAVIGTDREFVGRSQLREFFVHYLSDSPKLSESVQFPAIVVGDIALTSSRHDNGDISVEVARRQPDGSWRWIIDQFSATRR